MDESRSITQGSPPRDSGDTGGVTLRALLLALDSAVVELIDAPAGEEVTISSVTLVDSTDLTIDDSMDFQMPELYLLVGVGPSKAAQWLQHLSTRPDDQPPRALLSKVAHQSAHVRALAHDAGVALVAVHPQARWDRVYSLVRGVLDDNSRRQRADPIDADLLATDTDLFGLAQTIARSTGGMVSIEDERSQVLAYSASDESADDLRKLSILGRKGPAEYLRVLQQWGVFDKLRNGDDVVDVPAHAEMGTKRRLVVSIRQPPEEGGGRPRLLGSIWVQQGGQALAAEASVVLRGAAAVAANMISRDSNAPTAEALNIQRLFGARGGGADMSSLAASLSISTSGPAAVVGFAQVAKDESHRPDVAELANALRLRASSLQPDSVTAVIGGRAYVLFPRFHSMRRVTSWASQVVVQLQRQTAVELHAAIAAPVDGCGEVATARSEVDRVLDGTAGTSTKERVSTLASSRTTVLLGEILTLIDREPKLRDPRIGRLIDYDDSHSSGLLESAETYLAHHGDVRRAAVYLQIHPNTLRYRMRRVRDVTGIDLGNPPDRLLTELLLAVHRRTTRQANPRR